MAPARVAATAARKKVPGFQLFPGYGMVEWYGTIGGPKGWGYGADRDNHISHLLDKPADPTILSHRTVEPNLTARKLTSLATHAIPIPDKRGLTHRSRRPRGDIAT